MKHRLFTVFGFLAMILCLFVAREIWRFAGSHPHLRHGHFYISSFSCPQLEAEFLTLFQPFSINFKKKRLLNSDKSPLCAALVRQFSMFSKTKNLMVQSIELFHTFDLKPAEFHLVKPKRDLWMVWTPKKMEIMGDQPKVAFANSVFTGQPILKMRATKFAIITFQSSNLVVLP